MADKWFIETYPKTGGCGRPDSVEYFDEFAAPLARARQITPQMKDSKVIRIFSPADAGDHQRRQVRDLGFTPFF